MSTKATCPQCSASILLHTAQVCDGICMPCFKQQNDGMTPHQRDTLRDLGLLDLRAEYRVWHHDAAYPSAAMEDVGSYSPTLIEDVIDGYIAEFFERGGHLPEATRADFFSCVEDLSKMLPQLDASARPYFEILHTFSRSVLKFTAEDTH